MLRDASHPRLSPSYAQGQRWQAHTLRRTSIVFLWARVCRCEQARHQFKKNPIRGGRLSTHDQRLQQSANARSMGGGHEFMRFFELGGEPPLIDGHAWRTRRVPVRMIRKRRCTAVGQGQMIMVQYP